MKRLLIADDEQSLYLLRVLLEGNGFEVEAAPNGAVALEMARRHPPDMIVTDILMPVMDDFTLCRWWKADEKLRPVPFVFYTATYTDPKDEEFALSLGAEKFIVKPTEPDRFIQIIREVYADHVAGRLAAPRQPERSERVYLRKYNQTLVRKLDKKLAQLAEANLTLNEKVAEQARTEQLLRESEERFRAAANSATDLIWEWNPKQDTIVWFGDVGGRLGYADTEAPHTLEALRGLLHPDDRDRVAHQFGKAPTSGTAIHTTFRIREQSGRYRYWKTHAQPIGLSRRR